MKGGHESSTAAYMALFRAVESARPEEGRLFTDPLAKSLLPTSLRLVADLAGLPVIGRAVPAILDLGWPRTRSSGVVRTRLIDTMVQEALNDGAAQLVLLGAGYDSRAYRLPLAREVTVFEVDHPATQRAKRARLGVSGTSVAHVRFVGVDFELENIADRLADAGFDERARSILVWEGVISYLSESAVDDNFELLSRICSVGSRLIFQFHQRPCCPPDGGRVGSGSMVNRSSSVSTPTGWNPTSPNAGSASTPIARRPRSPAITGESSDASNRVLISTGWPKSPGRTNAQGDRRSSRISAPPDPRCVG